MANLSDSSIQELLSKPYYAVVSTHGENGSIHNAVVWQDADADTLYLNSAIGRVWPSNLERDPNVTVTVINGENPYEYVTVTGKADSTTDGADEHIDKLAKKYLDADSYPFRQEGEERIIYRVTPDKVRYVKQ
jgi:PPOX class probable F420-dependent enzyme